MSKFVPFVLALGLATFAHAGPGIGLGRPATSVEISRMSISVATDGTGLPDGRGSALEGKSAYNTRCASCHGVKGEGGASGSYPALVGGFGTLASKEPVQTVGSFWPYATTTWDYINRAMPYQNPGSLSANEVYSITAYILFMNGIVKENDVLDRKTLPLVQMPNRNGFVNAAAPDFKPR